MVTSFRPKCAFARDDTVLTTVRAISNLSELYYQFSEYRLEILEERIRTELKLLRETRQAGKKFNTRKLKQFLHEQEKFLEHMNREIVEDVKKGVIDDSHLLSVNGASRAKKRARLS